MRIVYASSIAPLDSNVATGGGTDATEALQSVLDTAGDPSGLTLVLDGAALVRGLVLRSNTTIECPNRDCGLFLADNANRPLLSNASWSLKERVTRNITLIGGTYNQNCAHQNHDVPWSQPCPYEQQVLDWHSLYLFEFYGVENFIMRDMTLRDQRTFALTMGNFENVVVENVAMEMHVHVIPSNQDGLHFFGPGRYLTIRNLRGRTGDDILNIAPDEMDGVSSITDVLIDGLTFDDTCQGVRMLSRGKGRLDRLTMRNVTGNYRTFAFSVNPFFQGNTFGNFGDLLFENIDVRQIEPTFYYTPFQFFQLGGDIECVTLRNIRFHRPIRNDVFFHIGDPFFEEDAPYPDEKRPRIGTLVIDGLTVCQDNPASAGTEYMTIENRVDNLVLRHIDIFRSASAPAAGHLVRLGDNASVGNLLIEDVFAQGLESAVMAGEGHRIDLLQMRNITLAGARSLTQTDAADISCTTVENAHLL